MGHINATIRVLIRNLSVATWAAAAISQTKREKLKISLLLLIAKFFVCKWETILHG